MRIQFSVLFLCISVSWFGGCATTGLDASKLVNSYEEWCRDSYAEAVEGNADAQRNLGDCYSRGLGFYKQDFRLARAWYHEAAQNGDLGARVSMIRSGAYLSCLELDQRTGVDAYSAGEWGKNVNNTYCF